MKSNKHSLSYFLSILIALLFFPTLSTYAQSFEIERVEPPFWWVGMKDARLELMVYGKGISATKQVHVEKPGVDVLNIKKTNNPNYLFIEISIRPGTAAGPAYFELVGEQGKNTSFSYTFRKRKTDDVKAQGFDASDVIYLLMPDRFANGDTSNDEIEGMLEGVDRSSDRARHGGDFKGVENHLDYIKDLGLTAIWMTPVFENDMSPEYGAYHGYASTDLFRVDRRFGSNEEFKRLVTTAHDKGLKVIMDMIHNHIGDKHWWMNDLPAKDWLNDYEKYGVTNYRASVVSDPYASTYDLDKMTKGWFVKEMPDLNQRNPLLARYLIQNTIWWIEYAGIDGIRMDTYPYPFKEPMAEWVKAVLQEYPNFNIVGESWVQKPAIEAYWQKDFQNGTAEYNSYLPSVTDFPMRNAIMESLSDTLSFTGGVAAIYYVLAQDFVYSDPMKNVIFVDNHDLERYSEELDGDMKRYKMGLAYLMVTRGIPQFYYGTEVMMRGVKANGDGFVRQEFMGGWPDHERNAFTKSGRTKIENEAWDFCAKLLNWRKDKKVIHEGKLTHFLPTSESVYVLFRYLGDDVVMLVMNYSDEAQQLDMSIYNEIIKDVPTYKNVITGKNGRFSDGIKLDGMSFRLLEFKR